MVRRAIPLFALTLPLLIPQICDAALWTNVTGRALGVATDGWTNKVDLADVNGDGRVDILFANGGNYNEPGEPEQNGVWLNVGNSDDGTPRFDDASEATLGFGPDLTRVIKGRDVTGDGIVDIIAGNTYETQSRLYVGLGDGEFEERTHLLPAVDASIGDLEVGDLDADGDLDIVLADWGLDNPGGDRILDPFTAPGGQMLVWINRLNEDAGVFVDETAERMPEAMRVAWSWEMELVDIDGDFDLDVLASCKVCTGSPLFRNEDGVFTNERSDVPEFTNNYDFEPMFLADPDGGRSVLALATINDGDQVDPSNRFDLQEHIFIADSDGRLRDATDTLWPDEHNVGRDDNMVVVLDFDSDGDPDFLIGALGPEDDRLHINDLDGAGGFLLDRNIGLETGLSDTPGTLGVALADLNSDGKLDVVQSQGELATPEHVWLGDEIAADTAAPIVRSVLAAPDAILARVHDNKSPSRPHDWTSVAVVFENDDGELERVDMTWTGEFMWRAAADAPQGASIFRICAVDAAGNEGCSDATELEGKEDDVAGPGDGETTQGQGCSAASPRRAGLLWLMPVFVLWNWLRRDRS